MSSTSPALQMRGVRKMFETIRLWEESGGLLFAIVDDGPGFDVAGARGGHGYINMADRLGAFGGTVRWQSERGHGATVQGSIPLT